MENVFMAPASRKRRFRQRGRRFGVQRRRIMPRAALRGRRAVVRELKFFDNVKGSTNLATAGVILDDSINEIVQGVTESNRIGRKCTIRSVNIHGFWSYPTTQTVANMDNRFRILVYWDKQANGATAAVTDVLESASVDSFRNLANSGRFRVLYDRVFTITVAGGMQTAAGTPNAIPIIRTWTLFKSCNIPIEFSAATGAIGEIRSNNIGVLGLCSGAAELPSVGYTSRLRFSDN